MRSSTFSVCGAAALGFALAGACFSTWAPRPANAEPRTLSGLGPVPNTVNLGQNQTPPPQPLEIQALDADRFVVASREVRLLTRDGKTAQNMLVTVVTHYTVRGDRLIPIETVRLPTGYQLVTVEE